MNAKKEIYLLSIIALIIIAGIVGFWSIRENNKFELILHDDFETLNSEVWTPVIGDGCPDLCGWGNNELQYYTDDISNIRVEEGNLIIESHKKRVKNKDFTSAKLVTKNKVDIKWGKIEIKAKLPQAKGTWGAFWMMPTMEGGKLHWPNDGEIDIMEHVGYQPGVIYSTIHTQKFNHMRGTQKTDSIYVSNAQEEFHVYSLEWTENELKWLVDDSLFHHLQKDEETSHGWPFNDNKFHLILNLAVGGNWGGRMGIEADLWPQKIIVDYIRIYKYNSL